MKFSTVFKKFLRFLPIFAPVYEMACGNPTFWQPISISAISHTLQTVGMAFANYETFSIYYDYYSCCFVRDLIAFSVTIRAVRLIVGWNFKNIVLFCARFQKLLQKIPSK